MIGHAQVELDQRKYLCLPTKEQAGQKGGKEKNPCFSQDLIQPTIRHSSSIIRGWYTRPISGRRTKWTQPHPTSSKTD
jgi:hypothetical protein